LIFASPDELKVWLITAIFLVPAAAIAIPVHELGHGLAAYWQGDPSPRNRGYLKPMLRPFIEPYGAFFVLFFNAGWGQRIPVNEQRLRSLRERLVYAVGGSLANLLVAGVLGIALRLIVNLGAIPSPVTLQPLGLLAFAVYAAFFLNLSFAVFNLLPVPGLDGWRVAEALFRSRYARFFFDVDMRRQQIQGILLLVVVAASWIVHINLLAIVMAPLFQPLSVLLIGQCAVYTSLAPCLL
jgi:Zn-dependent protease